MNGHVQVPSSLIFSLRVEIDGRARTNAQTLFVGLVALIMYCTIFGFDCCVIIVTLVQITQGFRFFSIKLLSIQHTHVYVLSMSYFVCRFLSCRSDGIAFLVDPSQNC